MMAEVSATGYRNSFLGYRNNGGHLEECGDPRLGNGEIEYVCKQLVCSCSEDTARDAIWAGSLARVNTLKCLTHVGHGEGEPTVLVSGPHRWHCYPQSGVNLSGVNLSGSKISVSFCSP